MKILNKNVIKMLGIIGVICITHILLRMGMFEGFYRTLFSILLISIVVLISVIIPTTKKSKPTKFIVSPNENISDKDKLFYTGKIHSVERFLLLTIRFFDILCVTTIIVLLYKYSNDNSIWYLLGVPILSHILGIKEYFLKTKLQLEYYKNNRMVGTINLLKLGVLVSLPFVFYYGFSLTELILMAISIGVFYIVFHFNKKRYNTSYLKSHKINYVVNNILLSITLTGVVFITNFMLTVFFSIYVKIILVCIIILLICIYSTLKKKHYKDIKNTWSNV